MTVADLIANVLDRIRSQHYQDRVREFKRDERQLMQSVARYGYECTQRAWPFDAGAIQSELMRVLDTMRGRDDQIRVWFPVYLESAVDRHVRLRAEELNAEAKKLRPKVDAMMRGLKTGELREPTPVEVLCNLYTDLRNRKRRTLPKLRKDTAQRTLF